MQKEKTTVEKGDDLESDAIDIINKYIDEFIIGPPREYLHIYPKKKYPSNLGRSDVEFDIAIEFWPPDAERCMFYYLIECKNYGKNVPTSEIEIFCSHLDQVTGTNKKGIIISNSPLQKGGYEIVKNSGLMFIQTHNGKNPKIVFHKTKPPKTSDKIPFFENDSDSSDLDKGLMAIEKMIDEAILSGFVKNQSKQKNDHGIERLSKLNIEQLAENELNIINPKILSDIEVLSIDQLKNFVEKQYDVDVVYFKDQKEKLGFFDAANNVIGISSKIKNSNREFFTLAHEFGHFVLHRELEIDQESYDNFEDIRTNFRHSKYNLKNPKHWIEWQANYFACSLLMPKVSLIAHTIKYQRRLKIREGKVYVDDAAQNQVDFQKLMLRLSTKFSVSKTSIIYRLNELNYIAHNTRLKHIGQIMEEYMEELLIDLD